MRRHFTGVGWFDQQQGKSTFENGIYISDAFGADLICLSHLRGETPDADAHFNGCRSNYDAECETENEPSQI